MDAERLLAAAEREPGFGAAAALADRVDPAGLDEGGRERLVALAGRLEAQAAGLRVAAVAALAGPEPVDEAGRLDDFADCAVAAALRVSAPAAARLVDTARVLTGGLTATGAALRAGQISYPQAVAVVDAAHGLAEPLWPLLQARLLPAAARQSAGQTRAAARRWVARLDPAGLARREHAARARARVHVQHEDCGTATVYVDGMGSAQAAILDTALSAWARSARAGGDPRSLDQLRVAALGEWASAYLTGPDAPRCHGRPVCIQLTIDLTTFLGLTEHPAETTGGELIPAQTARELCRDARLRRLITDPVTGWLLDYGQSTYRVPADLADAVAARYVTASSPGSTSPARYGDLDHDQPFAAGGPTAADNLHTPTRRWHRAKTRGRWHTRVHRNGQISWTSPGRRTYRIDPHDYRLGP